VERVERLWEGAENNPRKYTLTCTSIEGTMSRRTNLRKKRPKRIDGSQAEGSIQMIRRRVRKTSMPPARGPRAFRSRRPNNKTLIRMHNEKESHHAE